jgi:flavin reductase (DIM6/NTAB) family NADH-FMN oxidoreductase RutF
MYQEINASSTAFASMFNSIVAPRPIGWISSISAAGVVNLAPFSYFNGISPAPAMVMFACNGALDRDQKDTIANIREVPEFVANFACYELRAEINLSSATVPRGVNEFELTGLESAPARLVRPPMVKAAPANLECTLVRIVDLPPQGPGERMSSVVIGRVVAVHVQDRFIDADGRFDTLRANPLLRLGGLSYGTLGELLEIPRPVV